MKNEEKLVICVLMLQPSICLMSIIDPNKCIQ